MDDYRIRGLSHQALVTYREVKLTLLCPHFAGCLQGYRRGRHALEDKLEIVTETRRVPARHPSHIRAHRHQAPPMLTAADPSETQPGPHWTTSTEAPTAQPPMSARRCTGCSYSLNSHNPIMWGLSPSSRDEGNRLREVKSVTQGRTITKWLGVWLGFLTFKLNCDVYTVKWTESSMFSSMNFSAGCTQVTTTQKVPRVLPSSRTPFTTCNHYPDFHHH